MTSEDRDQDAADTREHAGAGGRGDQPEEPEAAQLAVGRRLDAEALGRLLEIVGAALGERERGVGHLPDPGPLLGAARGGERLLEVRARRLGVVALGGAVRRGSPARRPCTWSRPRAPRPTCPRAFPSRPSGRVARPASSAAAWAFRHSSLAARRYPGSRCLMPGNLAKSRSKETMSAPPRPTTRWRHRGGGSRCSPRRAAGWRRRRPSWSATFGHAPRERVIRELAGEAQRLSEVHARGSERTGRGERGPVRRTRGEPGPDRLVDQSPALIASLTASLNVRPRSCIARSMSKRVSGSSETVVRTPCASSDQED